MQLTLSLELLPVGRSYRSRISFKLYFYAAVQRSANRYAPCASYAQVTGALKIIDN